MMYTYHALSIHAIQNHKACGGVSVSVSGGKVLLEHFTMPFPSDDDPCFLMFSIMNVYGAPHARHRRCRY
jgi:hypothetical protein